MRIRDQTLKLISYFIGILLLLLLFLVCLAFAGLSGFVLSKFITILITVQGG